MSKTKQEAFGCMVDQNDGPDSIPVYADGSFSGEAGFGAWAFRAPSLSLEGVGSSPGRSVLRFEFLAVLEGLEAVLDADRSGLPIHVFSDCDEAIAMIERLSAGLPLKTPEKYADRADLLPRLQSVLNKREVRTTRFGLGRLEHQACHRAAAAKLREDVDGSPELRHELALKRNRARLAQLSGQRGAALRNLERLDEEISIIQLEIEALELSLRRL
jgi:ribonuclease HI